MDTTTELGMLTFKLNTRRGSIVFRFRFQIYKLNRKANVF